MVWLKSHQKVSVTVTTFKTRHQQIITDKILTLTISTIQTL